MNPELKCAGIVAGLGLLACIVGILNEISLTRPYKHLRMITVVVGVSMLVTAVTLVVHLMLTGGMR